MTDSIPPISNESGDFTGSGESIQSLTAGVTAPATLSDILDNIKIVWDRGLLLREELYTVEMLKLILGCQEVVPESRVDSLGNGFFSNRTRRFSHILPKVSGPRAPREALGFRLKRVYRKRCPIEGVIEGSFISDEPVLMFEKFVQIFGFPSQIPYLPRMHENTSRFSERPIKVHKYGNEFAQYIEKKSDLNKNILIHINGNGFIKSAFFSNSIID